MGRGHLIGVVMALLLTACTVEQTEEGELPDVEIEGDTELPEYDVDASDVDVAEKPSFDEGGHGEPEKAGPPLVDWNLRYATVFFGTNRGRGAPCRGVRTASASTAAGCIPGSFYGSETSGLEVGTLRVTFPPDHEQGMIERPFEVFGIRLRREDPDKDVVLAEVHSYGRDLEAWAADLRETGRKRARRTMSKVA